MVSEDGHSFLFKKKIYLLYFWLCWVFAAVHGLSLAVESRGYSLAVACRLLIVMVSLFVSTGSVAVVHGLSCPWGMWDLP